MAKLTYGERKAMPKSEFAVPSKREGGKGGYPIPNASHARNALARVAQHGSPAEKKEVRAKVHAKFPGIGEKKSHGMEHPGGSKRRGESKADHRERMEKFARGGK